MVQYRLRQPEDKILSRWGFLKPYKPVLNHQHPINKDLQGCWMLGDSGLGPFNDLSGQGNTGYSESVAVSYVASHHRGYGSAFLSSPFDAVKCGTSLGLTGNLNTTTALTLTCWANWDGTGSFPRILSNSDGTNGYNFVSYNITTNPAIGLIKSGTTTVLDMGFQMATHTWVFFAITYDNAVAKLYYNGSLAESLSSSNLLGTSTQPFCIGGTNSGSNYFSGGIEGVRVFSRALTASEVLQLYTEPYAGINDAAYDRKVFGINTPTPSGPYQDFNIWG